MFVTPDNCPFVKDGSPCEDCIKSYSDYDNPAIYCQVDL